MNPKRGVVVWPMTCWHEIDTVEECPRVQELKNMEKW